MSEFTDITQQVDDLIESERAKPPRHPAKFSDDILTKAVTLLDEAVPRDVGQRPTLYDPFAGTGKGVDFMNANGYDAWGTELEVEWASMSADVYCGGALPYMRRLLTCIEAGSNAKKWDLVFTSPCYANRMADHHEAKDDSKRNTYRHQLGRPLTEGSAAGMQWGKEYRAFHTQAWSLVYQVLRPGGYFLLNVKDHIRNGEQQPVSLWHRDMVQAIGFEPHGAYRVRTPGNRQGQNGEARVDFEWLFLFRKPV